MHSRAATVLVVSSLAIGPWACKRSEPPASQGAAPAAAPSSAPSPAGGSPVAVTAPALFAEHVAAGGMMPDLGKKYAGGALVTGEVGSVLTDLGVTYVQLKAGEGKRVALTFVDQGATVRARGVKVGDTITVLCQLGEMSGAVEVVVGACALQ